MDRVKVTHAQDEYYVLYSHRSVPGINQCHVRGLESTTSPHRCQVPDYKKEEIRQKLQDIHGTDCEVVF